MEMIKSTDIDKEIYGNINVKEQVKEFASSKCCGCRGY